MPTFIDSVYNYCHRWCERCPFTERCSLVSNPQRLGPALLEDVLPLPNAFPAVSGSFAYFLDRLDEQLRRYGLSLAEISFGAERESPLPTRTHISTLAELSMEVAVDSIGRQTKRREWLPELYNDPDFTDPAVQAGHELFWYMTMIGPKFCRSVESGFPPDEEEVRLYGKHGRDAAFTARLVHLVLSRVICSITVLLEARGEEAYSHLIEPLKKVFLLLAGLREEHPEAYRHRRPGFDDPGERRFLEAFYAGHPPVDPFRDGTWSRGGRAPES